MSDAHASDKDAIRHRVTAARAREAVQMPKAGEALATRTPAALVEAGFTTVAGYAPVNNEIEPGGVMAVFRRAGAGLCLPRIETGEGPAGPLSFRAWDFGEPLEVGAFGVRQPAPDAARVRPDLVLCPCVAFDHDGFRLGYGGGYYDRTLEALRAKGPVTVAILAYEIQRVWDLPREPHDQRGDWIITEAAAYEVFDVTKSNDP